MRKGAGYEGGGHDGWSAGEGEAMGFKDGYII